MQSTIFFWFKYIHYFVYRPLIIDIHIDYYMQNTLFFLVDQDLWQYFSNYTLYSTSHVYNVINLILFSLCQINFK